MVSSIFGRQESLYVILMVMLSTKIIFNQYVQTLIEFTNLNVRDIAPSGKRYSVYSNGIYND